jgi:HSP20 family protein
LKVTIMDPDEWERRRKEHPFDKIDELFEQFGIDPNEFDRMFRDMHRNVLDAMKSGSGIEPGKPFVAGFSFKMGPDGRPIIENFGNRPQRVPGGIAKMSDEREPVTDVVDEGDKIAVTMEIPGVDKSEIRLQARDDALEVSVDSERRKYHKIVRLPATVKPQSAKATYKNGVLDVTMERAEKGDGGVPVTVD